MDLGKERTLLTLDFSDLDETSYIHPDSLGRAVDELLASGNAPTASYPPSFWKLPPLPTVSEPDPPTLPRNPLPRVTRPPRKATCVGVAPPANPVHSAPPTLPSLPRVTRPPRKATCVGVAPPSRESYGLPPIPPPLSSDQAHAT